MLKQTVQFTDFDDVNKTKVLYFNLTRAEVIDEIDLIEEFEATRDMIGGEQRLLTRPEVKVILELVKKLMKLSYGIQRRTADGDLKFTKAKLDPQIWDDFVETAYYDAFLLDLFENTEKATAFMFGIWPKEITDGIDMAQLQLPGMPVKMDGQPLQAVPDVPVAPAESNGKSFDDYSRAELVAMPTEQFNQLVGTTDPLKMTQYQLQVAFARKNAGTEQ